MLYELVVQVNYKDIFIKILTDSLNFHRHFFFEPVVHLDRKHIVIESYDLLQQEVHRFTGMFRKLRTLLHHIHPVNSDARSKNQSDKALIRRLQSLSDYKDFEIDEGDISTMSDEDVYV